MWSLVLAEGIKVLS